MFKTCLENVRSKSPLIHNITNYVTVNDVANVLLAIGASPIMADEKLEVEEITSICTGLNINIGTLQTRTIESMKLAGKKANQLNHPITLDPVGTGASNLRTQTSLDLIKEVNFNVIKGNISEIKTLVLGTSKTQGVDAAKEDLVNSNNLDDAIKLAKELSKTTKAITVITGPIDIVTDGNKTYLIKNGSPKMTSITGTGCQSSALICAFISANQDNQLEATAAAISTMGLAGQIAENKLEPHHGNSTYRNLIIDTISIMTGTILEEGAVYEVR